MALEQPRSRAMQDPTRQATAFPSAMRVARELAPHLGRGLNLLVLDRVDSTNLLARQIAEQSEAEALSTVAVLALEQERGSGRGDRKWSSRPGAGVWVSWLGEIDLDVLPTLPSRIGVSLCRRLERLGARDVGLKWPNDLICERRKLGGILCRSLVRGERTVAVCGLGVNLENPGGGLEKTAIGLREVGVEAGLVEVAAECVRAVDLVAREAATDDSTASGLWRGLLDRYSVHRPGDAIAWHAGEAATDASGRRRGRFLGFDEAGRLLVEVEGKREVLSSGEIE